MNIEKHLLSEERVDEGVVQVLGVFKDVFIILNNLNKLRDSGLSKEQKKEIIDNNLPRITKLLSSSKLSKTHKDMIIAGLRSIPEIQSTPIYNQVTSRYSVR